MQAGGGLYIERPADHELFDLCRAGEYAFVLTTRQVGKSSLMFRARERLREEGVLSVIVDLQRIGAETTSEQWYLGLVDRISDTLLAGFNVIGWWQEHAQFSHAERLTRFFQVRVNWSRRLMYAAACLIVTLLLVSVPVSIYAWGQKNKAERSAQAEREARKFADEQRQIAVAQTEEATRQRELADIRTAEAQQERRHAVKAASAERIAKGQAEAQRNRAEKSASAERIAKAEAVTARDQAVAAKNKADAAAIEAERQRNFAQAQQKIAEAQQKTARSRELAPYAQLQLRIDPELSFQLAARAVDISHIGTIRRGYGKSAAASLSPRCKATRRL